jgi:hypothetical protein
VQPIVIQKAIEKNLLSAAASRCGLFKVLVRISFIILVDCRSILLFSMLIVNQMDELATSYIIDFTTRRLHLSFKFYAMMLILSI